MPTRRREVPLEPRPMSPEEADALGMPRYSVVISSGFGTESKEQPMAWDLDPKTIENNEELKQKLVEMFEDSPLNDEPLTEEQKARVDRLMGRKSTPCPRPRRRGLAGPRSRN